MHRTVPLVIDYVQDLTYLSFLLQAACATLNFDFIGTCTDESVDDFRTVQIPASMCSISSRTIYSSPLPAAWRDTIADPSTLQIFFTVYLNTSPPVSGSLAHTSSFRPAHVPAEYALGSLVHLASVRRTLFSNEQVVPCMCTSCLTVLKRMAYLAVLLQGVLEIVRTSQGLDQQSMQACIIHWLSGLVANFHECCRILARLKTNYQVHVPCVVHTGLSMHGSWPSSSRWTPTMRAWNSLPTSPCRVSCSGTGRLTGA